MWNICKGTWWGLCDEEEEAGLAEDEEWVGLDTN